MNDWEIVQLTIGTADEIYHSHSYYDLNVFDAASRTVIGHQMRGITKRKIKPSDRVEIGLVDVTGDQRWQPIGDSHAWSWQQGPMAQWIPNSRRVLWNDRDNGRFVTRVYDTADGSTHTLPIPSYAVDPAGGFTLGVNMARLDTLRPGYGYRGGSNARLDKRHPGDDGVWRQTPSGEAPTLILSLKRATHFLMSRLPWKTRLGHIRNRNRFWFNHVKISPDGKRFTVKLRFRSRDPKIRWSDTMGVSLTCAVDGTDLRYLADATSHVMWLDANQLYFWRKKDGVCLYRDAAPEGRFERLIAPEAIKSNAHLRFFPGSTDELVFDTPYRETIDLFTIRDAVNAPPPKPIARFTNHKPRKGQYRCDLHPCPSPDGQKIVVTSLDDGGRQIYVLFKRDN